MVFHAKALNASMLNVKDLLQAHRVLILADRRRDDGHGMRVNRFADLRFGQRLHDLGQL